MNIEIRATNVDVTTALEKHVTSQVRAALGPQRDQLERILVRICDANGPSGGRDIHCHMVANLRGRTLVVHDLADDSFAAVVQTSAQLAELMVSVIERHRTSRDRRQYATSVTAPSEQ